MVQATANRAEVAAQAPQITDPTDELRGALGTVDRWLAKALRDERDVVFVKLALRMSATLIPLAVWLFWPSAFRWWLAAIYWTLYLSLLGPYVLMLHNTSHRTLFNKRLDPLNRYIPWVVGPLVGMSPDTYYAHHIGMHHAEGNLEGDLSSTIGYQRDSFADFIKYFLRFLFGHYQLSRYFRRRGRHKLLRRFWTGELFFFALTAAALAYDWRPAVVVFVVPLIVTRFMLMAGNWAQHAFVDPDEPDNDYRSVITFINSPYNHRCFNDGYHLGHHLKPNRHWLDMPADFLAKRQEMIRQGSIVFRRLDYFMIFLLLMLKRHRTLARFYVRLDGSQTLDDDEVVALLKRRLRKLDARSTTMTLSGPVSDRKQHIGADAKAA